MADKNGMSCRLDKAMDLVLRLILFLFPWSKDFPVVLEVFFQGDFERIISLAFYHLVNRLADYVYHFILFQSPPLIDQKDCFQQVYVLFIYNTTH